MSFFCIINPYTGTEKQMAERANQASLATLELLKLGIPALSVNVHNDAIEKRFNITPDIGIELFLPLSEKIIESAIGVIVLKLDGWEKSNGVRMEIEYAKKNNVPVFYLSVDDIVNNNSVLDEIRKA